MNYIRKIKNIFAAGSIVFLTSLGSCTDEDLNSKNPYTQFGDEGPMVCIPIGLSFDKSSGSSTRATGDFVNGMDADHIIDFDTENECYAIFFITDANGKKKVKYMRPLFYEKQLTETLVTEPNDLSEYTVYAVAYVPATDIEGDTKLSDVLVVLNGGPVYQKLFNLIYVFDDEGNPKVNPNLNLTDENILNVTWDYPMYPDDSAKDHSGKFSDTFESLENNGPIGINANGYYTMTNSAYFENGKLMTLQKLEQVSYSSVDQFLKDENRKPSATVFLERMVSKFSEPQLDTEIFGSERFFRPSDKVPQLVIYDWDGTDLQSREIDWRIHLLGWTINGQETKNFIFKNIYNTDYPGWSAKDWNNPGAHRSYWSVDPNYDTGFYPWQYRKAADLAETVSFSSGVSQNMVPSLHYTKFSDVRWYPELYAPENTYSPHKTNWNLDNRESLLAGPHLLITGELYLKGMEGGIYLPDFGPVDHLYCDRVNRYYLKESDWFKMFVRDFNRILSTQEAMSFSVLDWDNPDIKINSRFNALPSGDCRLYYRHPKNYFTDTEFAEISAEANYFTDPDDDNYYFTEVTFKMIDILEGKGLSFSTEANISKGDGRLVPWLENLCVKMPNPVPDADPLPLAFEKVEGSYNPNGKWTTDMYKSLFAEWFGAVDHFNGGKMYYAGAIKHKSNPENLPTYYGNVRNHWYKFTISSINGIGTAVDSPDQFIIPDKYAYNDLISVQLEIIGWHLKSTEIEFGE